MLKQNNLIILMSLETDSENTDVSLVSLGLWLFSFYCSSTEYFAYID